MKYSIVLCMLALGVSGAACGDANITPKEYRAAYAELIKTMDNNDLKYAYDDVYNYVTSLPAAVQSRPSVIVDNPGVMQMPIFKLQELKALAIRMHDQGLLDTNEYEKTRQLIREKRALYKKLPMVDQTKNRWNFWRTLSN